MNAAQLERWKAQQRRIAAARAARVSKEPQQQVVSRRSGGRSATEQLQPRPGATAHWVTRPAGDAGTKPAAETASASPVVTVPCLICAKPVELKVGQRSKVHPGACTEERDRRIKLAFNPGAVSEPAPAQPGELVAITARPARFVGQCKAVDANSGSTCKLPAGHVGPHGCERGQFIFTLQAGQQSALDRALAVHATRQGDGAVDHVSSGANGFKPTFKCRGCGRNMRSANEGHDGLCIHCRDKSPRSESKPKPASLGELNDTLGAFPAFARRKK